VDNVEAVEECGTKYVTLVDGVYGLTGTFERFHTGSQVWPLGGITHGHSELDYIDFKIYPNGITAGQPYIALNGCKVTGLSASHRPSASLMIETWTFIGTGSVEVGTN
jgi:hypothetical protein